MRVLRDPKLWKAVGLAVGLFAFVFVGLRLPQLEPDWTVWETQIRPRLQFLAPPTGVVLVALVTASILRPRRPQRLAAIIGCLGEVIVFVAPWRHVETGALGVAYFASLLTVSCWIGADYWAKGSWGRFWRGPGGAMLKGGLTAGLVSAFVFAPIHEWAYPSMVPRTDWKLLEKAVMGLSAIPPLALLTGVLSPWRPTRAMGAFAGAGIATGLIGLAMPLLWHPLLSTPGVSAAGIIVGFGMEIATAAIAGSFAGRWEPEPLPDE